MPEIIYSDRYHNGGTFYCPNGHGQQFRTPTVVRLQKELDEKARLLTAAKCEAATERAKREKIEHEMKRQSARVKNGVWSVLQSQLYEPSQTHVNSTSRIGRYRTLGTQASKSPTTTSREGGREMSDPSKWHHLAPRVYGASQFFRRPADWRKRRKKARIIAKASKRRNRV